MSEQRRAVSFMDFPLANTRRLIVVDTETTGLDPHVHQPWEVAWCDITRAVTHDVPLSTCQTRVLHLPHSLRDADPVALRVGRYDERAGGLTSASPDAVHAMWRDLGGGAERPDKPVLVGSNPAFDAAMLGGLFHRSGLDVTPWHYRTLDVGDMAFWGLGWEDEHGAPLRLSALADRLGHVNGAAHTAAGDVATTAVVFVDLLARITASRGAHAAAGGGEPVAGSEGRVPA